MAGTLYLALECSGFETLVLTDGVNYSLDNQSGGWVPMLALDEEQYTVIDPIPINILPGAGAPTVRRNLIKLVQMLRQISRGQQGDGGVVTLVYTSPNSSPAQRIAAQVVGWNPETFLPSVNAAENLPVDTINVVTLLVEHRVPWVYVSYSNANLLTNSAWAVNPGWVESSAGGLTHVVAPLPAGGQGYLQLVASGFAAKTLTAPTAQSFNVVAGQTYTIFFRVAASVATGITEIQLWNATNTINISAAVAIPPQTFSASILTSVTLIRAVVVATTSDAQARIKIAFLPNTNPTTYQLGEFLVVAGNVAEDAWHRANSEEGVSSTSASTALGIIQTTALPPTSSPAPTRLNYTHTVETFTAGVLIVAKTGLITLYPQPSAGVAAPFTSLADAANSPVGSTIMRYTPTVTTLVKRGIAGPSAFTGMIVFAARVNGAASYDIAFETTLGIARTQTTRYLTLAPRTQPYFIVAARVTQPYATAWSVNVLASALGGSLDINWVAFVPDNANAHIITHAEATGTFSTNFTIDPRWLNAPLPTNDVFLSEDNPLITTDAASLDTLWVATDSTTKWRTTATPQLFIERAPAFDAPV